MRLSPTLSLYIGRQFLLSLLMVFALFMTTIFIFDAVELLRRASDPGKPVSFGTVLELALMKVPFMAQKAMPFAALIGGIITLTRMTRNRELVIARAAGVSVWQFLLPTIVIALVIGLFMTTVFNPFASAMVARYEKMEAEHLHGKSSLLALSNSGIWLRQGDESGQSVVHAERFDQGSLTLHGVIIFFYEKQDQFVGRIDAREAKLAEGHWDLTDALITAPDQPAEYRERDRVPTDLTLERIQDSFSPPETLSFWALPGFIKVLEDSGFSAVKHRLHWHSLLAGPLLLCAMVLIAATFSLRFSRRGTLVLIIGAILSGFLLYFVSDLTLAFGLSGKIPPVLAAWTPTGMFALLGIASLFHLEDG